MKHHKIKTEKDVIELQKWYEQDAIFECLETHEEFTLEDLRYNADWNDFEEITIQHI